MTAAHASRRVLVVTKNDFRLELDGGSKRTAAVVRELSAAGHRVDFVAVRPFATSMGIPRSVPLFELLAATLRVFWAAALSMSLSSAKWFSPRAVRAVLAAQRLDGHALTIIEHTQLFAYRAAVSGPTILDMHNIESDLLESYARSAGSLSARCIARFETSRMRYVESRVAQQFDAIVTVSAHDAEQIGRAHV